MKKLGYLILMMVSYRVCQSQNLVPNGDFEQYTLCPGISGQINYASPWVNPVTGTGGSPDYFNSCIPGNYVSTPYNFGGYQPAFSGGAYCGIVIHHSTAVYYEYIETPLATPLTAGSCYYFEMRVNLTDISQYGTDDIQVYFSNALVTGINNSSSLPFTPQIHNTTGNITDTLNWILISGNYIASGGENYLLIGNFKNTANTSSVLVNNQAQYAGCFVLIDDVSLTPCTDIQDHTLNAETEVYPNPFTGKLNVRNTGNELSEIILYDITSRKILQQKFTSSVSLNTEQLAKGVYLYEVRSKNVVIRKGKVVRE